MYPSLHVFVLVEDVHVYSEGERQSAMSAMNMYSIHMYMYMYMYITCVYSVYMYNVCHTCTCCLCRFLSLYWRMQWTEDVGHSAR